jgi:hypothetical protein
MNVVQCVPMTLVRVDFFTVVFNEIQLKMFDFKKFLEDSMMKNQPEVLNTRKRGNNRRRNKGRRAVHQKQT